MYVTAILAITLATTCCGLTYPRQIHLPRHFPNPEDCASFFRIYKGTHRLMYCPRGLLFDIESSICKDGKQVDCGERNVVEQIWEDAITPVRCPNVIMAQIPNPDDCSTFYNCWRGEIVAVQPCGGHLLFNKETHHCDWPNKANCCEHPTSSC